MPENGAVVTRLETTAGAGALFAHAHEIADFIDRNGTYLDNRLITGNTILGSATAVQRISRINAFSVRQVVIRYVPRQSSTRPGLYHS